MVPASLDTKEKYFVSVNFVFRAHDGANGAEAEHEYRFVAHSDLGALSFLASLIQYRIYYEQFFSKIKLKWKWSVRCSLLSSGSLNKFSVSSYLCFYVLLPFT